VTWALRDDAMPRPGTRSRALPHRLSAASRV